MSSEIAGKLSEQTKGLVSRFEGRVARFEGRERTSWACSDRWTGRRRTPLRGSTSARVSTSPWESMVPGTSMKGSR